jgi:hypothetical protein
LREECAVNGIDLCRPSFAPVDQLRDAIAARCGLSSHELGDACLIVPA